MGNPFSKSGEEEVDVHQEENISEQKNRTPHPPHLTELLIPTAFLGVPGMCVCVCERERERERESES